MVSRALRSIIVATIIVGFAGVSIAEDKEDEPDPTILRIALADAATTLQKGMTASEPHGMPISAKFEMSSGDMQLSVYTAKANGFIELLLDPKTGAVIEAAPITDAADLADATAQKAIMEKATMSLLAATEKAVRENAGSRAVSVVPELQQERPVAKVNLLRSRDITIVLEALN